MSTAQKILVNSLTVLRPPTSPHQRHQLGRGGLAPTAVLEYSDCGLDDTHCFC